MANLATLNTKWSDGMVMEHRRQRHVAVWVGGSHSMFSGTIEHRDGTQEQYGMGNRPCRALCTGLSTNFIDEVSKRLHQVPWLRQEMLARVWVKNHDDGKNLMTAMVRHLVDVGEATLLEKDWIDVGPDYHLGWLEPDLMRCAADNMIEAWSDYALVENLYAAAILTKHHEDQLAARAQGRPTLSLVRRQ